MADMRTLICICMCFAAVASKLHGQGQIFGPAGLYAGDLPHRANAKVVFRASIGEFNSGPLKMRLLGQDVATQEDVITFIVSATQRNGLIKAEFPFGGRFLGRYDSGRNALIGRFSGFAHRGQPNIPRQRFEMTHVDANAAAVAARR